MSNARNTYPTLADFIVPRAPTDTEERLAAEVAEQKEAVEDYVFWRDAGCRD